MTFGVQLLTQLYAALLRLHPRRFRAEFGAEMEAVFAEAVAGAAARGWIVLVGLLLRELRDWPGAFLQAYIESWSKGGPMSAQNDLITPSTRWEALVGALPFLAFGVSATMGKVAPIYGFRGHDTEMAVYFLALAGLLVGWMRGFPLWSYGYLGWSLSIAWSNTNLRVYGVDWGYRVWVPFGMMVLIALLWTRSLAPIRKLFRDIWNDWTRLSLAMFALGSWVFLIYDENHAPHLPLFMLAATPVVGGGAWLFLRSRSLSGRVFSIVGGFVGAAIIGGISWATWDWRAYFGLPRADQWYENLGVAPIGVLFWLLILFWPGIIGLTRWVVRERRAA